MCPYSSHHNSSSVAPFWACSISKCSSQDALHFVPLWHAHLSPSRCLNLWCKSAIWCLLLLLIRTWCFVIFVAFDAWIFWAWALQVFWSMPCHLYRGVCHVFWWSMWWLAQACKLGFVMFLFSGTRIFTVCYCCYFVAMYPCVYREIHASFGHV